MRIVVNIPDVAAGDPRAVATLARGLLTWVCAVNRLVLSAYEAQGRPLAPLYSSGVVFRREPWSGPLARKMGLERGLEEFEDVETIYRRGWADCDGLAAARCAELQHRGGRWKQTGIKVYWRVWRDRAGRKRRMWHVEVRKPPGLKPWPGDPRVDVEDPARYLKVG